MNQFEPKPPQSPADELNEKAVLDKIENESKEEYEEVLIDDSGKRYIVELDDAGEPIRTYLEEGQVPPKKKSVQ